MTRILLVMWRQSWAGAPCLVVAPALAVDCILMGDVSSSVRTEPLVVPAVGAREGLREGVLVMAQVAARHAATVAVRKALHAVANVLDIKPSHGALHGAEGLVYIGARAVVEAGVGLASRAG